MQRHVPDVVNVQQVMIDHALNEVEEAPAQDHLSDENRQAPRAQPSHPIGPQHQHAHERQDECGRMKHPVPHHVLSHRVHRRRRQHRRAHVVPLHDLMQGDTVHESTEP